MCLELPLPEALHFDQQVELQDDQFIIALRSKSPDAICPHCGQTSCSIQKRYWRRLTDLAIAFKPVILKVQARRFFCRNHGCSCRIFTEQIGELARRYSRCTERLRQSCIDQVLMSNASEASRVSNRRGVPISASTMLRRIRSDMNTESDTSAKVPSSEIPSAEAPPVSILGIDEFAFRKGHNYGTILVDQERHKIIDLLPTREPQAIIAWLKEHPQIKTITRDRSGGFAAAASVGAPQAEQTADRWHLFKNLAEALRKVLDRKRRLIKDVFQMGQAANKQASAPCEAVQNICPQQPDMKIKGEKTKREEQQEQSRLVREERYQEIHRLSALKLSAPMIAHQLGLDPRTVLRYLRCDVCPEHGATGRWRARLTQEQHRFVADRWDMGLHNVTEIHRQLVQDTQLVPPGSRVSRRTVLHYLDYRSRATTEVASAPMSVKNITWLVLKEPKDVSVGERAFLENLTSADPEIHIATDLCVQFGTMLRAHSETLSCVQEWITKAKNAGLQALHDFAEGLTKDLAAVYRAFSEPQSNGMTEGMNNKLKFIKRKMYGRAKFDLLRARVLRET